MSAVDPSTNLELRVADLIDRGLELYGDGDLEAALGCWKHALALDENNPRALDYVAYLQRHFAMASAKGAVAPADLEHEVPYGILTMRPISEAGIEAYESFELARAPSYDEEFGERVATRVNQLATELDEGWSLADPEFPQRRPRRGRRRRERERDREGLENELAAVAEGLEIAESGAVAVPGRERYPDPEPAAELELASHRKTDPRATALGYEAPLPPASNEGFGRDPRADAAEVSPTSLSLELGEPLELDVEPALELEAEPALEIEAEPALEIEAEPSAGPSIEMDEYPPFELEDSSFELQAPEEVSLELGKAGGVGAAAGLELDLDEHGSPRPRQEYTDVDISFREPGRLAAHEPRAAAAIDAAPSLEDQLAELEAELGSAGGNPAGWQPHGGVAALEPLPPPERRREPPPAAAPAPRVDAAALGDQILAEVEAAAPGQGGDEAVRRRIDGLIDRAELECSRGDLAAAAVAADLALAESPESAVAQKLLHQRSDPLVNAFRRFLGDLACTPVVALPMHELPLQELDHRAAFLISRIDGTLSFEDILDISGMPRLEALRYLCRLRLQGIVEVR